MSNDVFECAAEFTVTPNPDFVPDEDVNAQDFSDTEFIDDDD